MTLTYNYLECGGGDAILPPAPAAIPAGDSLEAMTTALFDAFGANEDERRDPLALDVYRNAAWKLREMGAVGG